MPFINNFKIYQESHQKFELINEITAKSSMDTGACYGVKKLAENVFRKPMTKGEAVAFWM